MCTTDANCTTAYATTDQCTVGSYCYNDVGASTFTCVLNCTGNGDCTVSGDYCAQDTMCRAACTADGDCAWAASGGNGGFCALT